MDLVWKYTGYLRKQYFDNFRSFSIKLGLAVLALIIVTCLFDFFFPFDTIYNVIRALILIIGGFIVFSAGYLVSFFFSQSNRRSNPDYIPVKERFSPNWRKRIGIVVGAFLIAIILSTSHSIVYTLVNCCVVAAFAALIIFLTMTEEEADREHYGVPDARDSVYNENIKKAREKRLQKKADKKEKKNKK